MVHFWVVRACGAWGWIESDGCPLRFLSRGEGFSEEFTYSTVRAALRLQQQKASTKKISSEARAHFPRGVGPPVADIR